MKRTISVAVMLGLLFGAAVAPADAAKRKKKTTRTVSARYENPAFGTPITGGLCSGCPSFPAGPNETYAKIVVKDDVNPGAGSRFSWDTDGDGTNDTGFYVCGSTEEPIQIPASTSITAFPYPSGHPTECPGGAATAGEITVTFSNKP